MSKTLKATFATRREAEMTVERLVQEYGIERTDIFVVADGDENTAGEYAARADVEPGEAAPVARDDVPLHGQINVSVDIADDAVAEQVRAAFEEFQGEAITED